MFNGCVAVSSKQKRNDLAGFGKALKKSLKMNPGLYIMIAPVLFYYILFHYWPMFGIQIAFKEYMPALGFWESPWVGLKHFERFFNSYYFVRLIRNTVGISFYGFLVGIPAPVILAVMFNELRYKRLKSVCQTISYTPHFLSIVVLVGIINFFLSSRIGVINTIIGQLGGKQVEFLKNPEIFWHIYVWSGVWQGVGWSSIIYTTAIAGIPQEQYEAAYIDGASKLQRLWYITLPGIAPTIVILAILSAGNLMNVGFEKIFLMQNAFNISASDVIATYVYNNGLLGAQYSFTTAIGLFNNIVNFILLATVNFIASRLGETSLW